MVSAADHARRTRARLMGLSGRTVLVIAAVVVAVAAADRSHLRADLSADHRFSISDSLGAILAAQSETVELVGIWPRRLDELADPVAQAAIRIAAAYPRVVWKRIDPELDQPARTAFAEKYHDATSPTLEVCRGSRAFPIHISPSTRSVLQRELGGALLALADPKQPKAVLMQGHGELGPQGSEEDGSDQLQNALALGNFHCSLHASGQLPPPDPDSVLILAGPQAAIGKPDLALLGEHLRDGGGVMIFADDRCPGDLSAFLRKRGVFLASIPQALGSDAPFDVKTWIDDDAPVAKPLVVASARHHGDAAGALALSYLTLKLDNADGANVMLDRDHQASQAVASSGRAVISPWTTVCIAPDLAQKDPDAQGMVAAIAGFGLPLHTTRFLCTAADDTWLAPRSDSIRVPGRIPPSSPRTVAVAIEYAPGDGVRQDRGGRLVVWASRQAAADATLLQDQYANKDLIVDCARWLSGTRQDTSIPAAETRAFQVQTSQRTLQILIAALVAVLPCLFIGAAIIAWWERR